MGAETGAKELHLAPEMMREIVQQQHGPLLPWNDRSDVEFHQRCEGAHLDAIVAMIEDRGGIDHRNTGTAGDEGECGFRLSRLDLHAAGSLQIVKYLVDKEP